MRSFIHIDHGAPAERRAAAIGALACLSAGITVVLALVVAPPDAIQGQSQRLMYVHVPAAWTAFCAFAVVLACSVAVLLGRGSRWDDCARAAAELGTGMTALAIAEGSIWGHAVWGTWWTWDPRLVSTALLLLVYLGYLGVRRLSSDPRVNARRAAVVGAIGFLQVPVVHFSVLWFRSLHQPPTLLAPSTDPPIDPRMLVALASAVVTFMFAGGWFVLRRMAVRDAAVRSRPPRAAAGDPAGAPAPCYGAVKGAVTGSTSATDADA